MSNKNLPSSNSHQPKDEKRRLPLIKIRYSDLVEEEPLTSSKNAKATKKQKCTVTAVPSSLRKVPKPVRIPYNSSKWKDTPQLSSTKGGRNNKPNVPDNDIFTKPFKVSTTTDKGVRKDLFGGRRNPLRTSPSGNNGFKPRKLNIPSIKVELDNTQPLIDINEAEIQLYQKSDCFKVFNNLPFSKKSDSTEAVQTASKVEETSGGLNIETDNVDANRDFIKPLNISVLSEQNKTANSISPTECEFIKNEKICDVKNGGVEFTNKLKSCIAKSSTSNNIHDVLVNFIQNEQESFNNINDKFQSLNVQFLTVLKQFQEFQIEISGFKERHARNVNQIMEYLDPAKENFATVTDLNGLSVENSVVKCNKKKNVAFNFNNCINNDRQINKNIELDDKGLEKAVNFYNTMRQDYKGILTTPKLDRSVLHTPKSQTKVQADSISRRLQKQCLMLLDTPTHHAK